MATTPATLMPVEDQLASVEVSQLSTAWHRFRRQRTGLIALLVLALMVLGVVLVPAFSPFDYLGANPVLALLPAGSTDPLTGHLHLLGTDRFGRDLFARGFYAGRASLTVALLAALTTAGFGALVGAIAGFYGRWVDAALMRFTDFMLALPLLPMYIFAMRLLITTTNTGRDRQDTWGGTITVFLVFVIFSWMGISRLTRGTVLSLRSHAFVEAALALGASNRRIIFKHLLPNAIAPILVATTFTVADFVVWETILAYFAQGIIDPPVPSWGNLIVSSMGYIAFITSLNPFDDIRGFVFLFPIILLFVTVLAINYIGDALRTALDPRGIVT